MLWLLLTITCYEFEKHFPYSIRVYEVTYSPLTFMFSFSSHLLLMHFPPFSSVNVKYLQMLSSPSFSLITKRSADLTLRFMRHFPGIDEK